MTNEHCIVCDDVYYGKERLWLPNATFQELELGKAEPGVLHDRCLDEYLTRYIHTAPQQDRDNYRILIEKRIVQLGSDGKTREQ